MSSFWEKVRLTVRKLFCVQICHKFFVVFSLDNCLKQTRPEKAEIFRAVGVIFVRFGMQISTLCFCVMQRMPTVFAVQLKVIFHIPLQLVVYVVK